MNDCKHCGGWLQKVHEMNKEIVEKDAEIKRLTESLKEANDMILKGRQ